MFSVIFEFFYNLFYLGYETTEHSELLDNFLGATVTVNVGGTPIAVDLAFYFSFLASFISLIIIVVLCCFFIYKIVKLIGGLIR